MGNLGFTAELKIEKKCQAGNQDLVPASLVSWFLFPASILHLYELTGLINRTIPPFRRYFAKKFYICYVIGPYIFTPTSSHI